MEDLLLKTQRPTIKTILKEAADKLKQKLKQVIAIDNPRLKRKN